MHLVSRANALVQLQAHYHHCGEAASEKCLSAATFVRRPPRPTLGPRHCAAAVTLGALRVTSATHGRERMLTTILSRMPVRVYCERNAMRPWLRDLEREGRIVRVLFPYDGNNPRDIQLATPSVVTCDSTWIIADMAIRIGDMEASEKLEQIRMIIRRANEKRIAAPAGLIGEKTEGDARHLDSAYKSGCRAFFTTDKRDILTHATELEPLLGLRLFHPDDDQQQFGELVVEALQIKRSD
jgi:hypothetical protein